MQWTESQLDAVNSLDGTVLVAAAAGSGKTAVLVQRAMQRLSDSQHPTDANRLLIVTFTKAAAAEMRARLEQRLFQLLREEPGNRRLRRQSVLLHQAQIGTVDSFCADMVREFFHLLGLTPDFKILSDKQEEELMSLALDEVMGEAFEAGKMEELADAFVSERNDARLMGMALTLYRFMQSHPFPEKWLEEKLEMYLAGDPSPWEQVILSYAAGAGEYCGALLSNALTLAQEDSLLYDAFAPALSADREACLALAQAARAGDWEAAAAARNSFSPKRRGALRGFDKEDALLLRLEACREEVKKTMKGLKTCLSGGGTRAELAAAAPLLQSLGELTVSFSRRYQEKKRERGFLDYNDLEHCAVQLFCGEDGQPTPAAREVAARFDEIMIDEYQDINEVQDAIFRAVSRQGENLFMVGDVKQSIYGFRRAMPELFLRCRRAFGRYEREQPRYPACIVLDRNFRSRREVTDGVNFVFSQLMSREAGDIDYTGEERLVCGADYPEKAGCETEAVFLSRGDIPAESAEAGYIARRIQALLDEGFTITENGAERPAHYGDFCILLRSANKHAHVYAGELKRRGIPARATVSGGFFHLAEIQTMLSLLRVIDNPNQDIPLLAVLMSPLWGFSADDAARLRSQDKEVSVYISLLRAGETDSRCAGVLEELRRLRDLSATMPADAFLTMLYGRTGYTDMVQVMEDGPARLENLRLLRRYAQEYESSGYHGLSGFVRFLDRLRDSGTDMQAAQVQPAGPEAVSIMSIHKSKGLQFPVCIVAGCGRQFVGDKAQDVLLHPELGLGVKLRMYGAPARATTTPREAIALETARSAAAEELRVLYVAMTRAKEKLILVTSQRDMDAALDKAALELTGGKPAPFTVRRAKSAGDWLLSCALRHPSGGKLRQRAGLAEAYTSAPETCPWVISLLDCQPEEALAETAQEEPAQPDMELLAALQAQAAFVYPYEDSLDIRAKESASKLAAEQAGDRELNLSKPAWLGAQGMTPSERGIALHEFMQFADFPAAAQNPAEEIRRLAELRFLSPEQAGAIEVPRVRAFFQSPLGRRVLASPEVHKERRFTAVIPPNMARPGTTGGEGETVILQGAVDCTFVEGDWLHIIDFKTDKVDTLEDLWGRYQRQIELYAFAMEEVTGMAVGEMFLYSTWLGQGEGREYKPPGKRTGE